MISGIKLFLNEEFELNHFLKPCLDSEVTCALRIERKGNPLEWEACLVWSLFWTGGCIGRGNIESYSRISRQVSSVGDLM